MEKKKYYIAYGSNLNISQMERRCPDSRVLGSGFLKDYRLLFRGSLTGSYLTIESKAGEKVPVGIWEVSSADEERLDRYEGYPNFYKKEEVEIEYFGITSGKLRKVKAFVYIMDEKARIGVPSAQYLRICKDGYRSFNFDDRYLDNALRVSLEGGGR